MTNDILAALASFCICLCMRRVLGSLSSCLIRLCNDVRASVVKGVTGVTGVTVVMGVGGATNVAGATDGWRIWSYGSAFGIVISAGGFGVCRRTLSGLNGNKPVAAHPARTFLVIAFCLAGAYREVKCSLPTVSKPPRYSRSTSSRYADFNSAKTPTSQGWSLWDV